MKKLRKTQVNRHAQIHTAFLVMEPILERKSQELEVQNKIFIGPLVVIKKLSL